MPKSLFGKVVGDHLQLGAALLTHNLPAADADVTRTPNCILIHADESGRVTQSARDGLGAATIRAGSGRFR